MIVNNLLETILKEAAVRYFEYWWTRKRVSEI